MLHLHTSDLHTLLSMLRPHSKQPTRIDQFLAMRARVDTFRLTAEERLAIVSVWRAKKTVDE